MIKNPHRWKELFLFPSTIIVSLIILLFFLHPVTITISIILTGWGLFRLERFIIVLTHFNCMGQFDSESHTWNTSNGKSKDKFFRYNNTYVRYKV